MTITHNTFSFQICVDNAAFGGDDEKFEVASLLEDAAYKVREGERFGRVKDTNGQRVGYWTFGTEEGDSDA